MPSPFTPLHRTPATVVPPLTLLLFEVPLTTLSLQGVSSGTGRGRGNRTDVLGPRRPGHQYFPRSTPVWETSHDRPTLRYNRR